MCVVNVCVCVVCVLRKSNNNNNNNMCEKSRTQTHTHTHTHTHRERERERELWCNIDRRSNLSNCCECSTNNFDALKIGSVSDRSAPPFFFFS